MRWSAVGKLLGAVWAGVAGVLALPGAVALALGEPWEPFVGASGTALLGAGVLLLATRGHEVSLTHREAFLVVTLAWCSICGFGALPYANHPDLAIPLVDALFESTSGFTTTGATVLSGLDGLSASLLLYRSFSQWLGGMGIVIFGIALLPMLGVGGMQLYKAETPGPTKEKMTPRVAETARLLWALYVGLTGAAGVAFWANGMTPFDALNHAMTSISTAGFSTHDQSLGFYDSPLLHGVATITMLVGGTSFVILHRVITGSGLVWSQQPELRVYLGVFCIATLGLTADLLLNQPGAFPGPLPAAQHAAFQAASILTTTGYTTRDYDLWPGFSHVLLFALFFIGGMAGSTAGGPKVIRIVLLARVAFLQFFRLAHRRAFEVVRLGPHTIDERVLAGSLGFLVMWLVLLAIGSVALAASGSDPVSSVAAAAASLGNIGPAFGEAGPSRTFAGFGTSAKLVIEALMILGRLEIYTVLIVLTPGFWRF